MFGRNRPEQLASSRSSATSSSPPLSFLNLALTCGDATVTPSPHHMGRPVVCGRDPILMTLSPPYGPLPSWSCIQWLRLRTHDHRTPPTSGTCLKFWVDPMPCLVATWKLRSPTCDLISPSPSPLTPLKLSSHDLILTGIKPIQRGPNYPFQCCSDSLACGGLDGFVLLHQFGKILIDLQHSSSPLETDLAIFWIILAQNWRKNLVETAPYSAVSTRFFKQLTLLPAYYLSTPLHSWFTTHDLPSLPRHPPCHRQWPFCNDHGGCPCCTVHAVAANS